MTNLAHERFGHKAMHAVGIVEKLERLRVTGKSWEDMPEVYRRGVYLRREKVMKTLTPEELLRIPEQHRPTGPVERTVVQPFELPLLEQLANPVDALLFGTEPKLKDEGSQEEGVLGAVLFD